MLKYPKQFILNFMYLKCQGNPLITLDYFKILIDHHLLILNENLIITDKFFNEVEELLAISVPYILDRVNGNIVDGLKCE